MEEQAGSRLPILAGVAALKDLVELIWGGMGWDGMVYVVVVPVECYALGRVGKDFIAHVPGHFHPSGLKIPSDG